MSERHNVDLFIDGQWQPAMAGGRIEILDPATEEVVATAAQAERADVEAAIEAARKAQISWRQVSAWDRSKVIRKAAMLLEERADAIARSAHHRDRQADRPVQGRDHRCGRADRLVRRRGAPHVRPDPAGPHRRQSLHDRLRAGGRGRCLHRLELPDRPAGAQDHPGAGHRLHHRHAARRGGQLVCRRAGQVLHRCRRAQGHGQPLDRQARGDLGSRDGQRHRAQGHVHGLDSRGPASDAPRRRHGEADVDGAGRPRPGDHPRGCRSGEGGPRVRRPASRATTARSASRPPASTSTRSTRRHSSTISPRRSAR